MKTGKVTLVSLLLLFWVAGCQTESAKTAAVGRRTGEKRTPSVPSSPLDQGLFRAVEQGNVERVRSLLAAGAAVNARDEGEETPLHRAVAAGRIEIVELLIAHGADVNAKGGIPGGTPLCDAVMGDYAFRAHELVRAERPDLEYRDDLYRDLVDQYAESLMLEMVQVLIWHGADVNARDESGSTVLFSVLADAPTEVVKLFLVHGANPGLRDNYGTTPLHEAAAQGRTDLVALFLDSGVSVDARDADKQAPLHEAVWQDDWEMVELLLGHGASVNVQDKNGDTPLHIAAVNGDVPVFDLLVSKGADRMARNKQGRTPAVCAQGAPPHEMVRLTAEGASPYSVIITRTSEVRTFLRNRRIAYDRIWIPAEADVRRAEAILKSSAASGKAGRKDRAPQGEPVATNLGLDSREYAGFMRGRAKYVLCNLNSHGSDVRPRENAFSGPGFDEEGAFRLAATALDTRQVEWIPGF
jgi:ankyrin repeat protein